MKYHGHLAAAVRAEVAVMQIAAGKAELQLYTKMGKQFLYYMVAGLEEHTVKMREIYGRL